jgi:hypothetical protein
MPKSNELRLSRSSRLAILVVLCGSGAWGCIDIPSRSNECTKGTRSCACTSTGGCESKLLSCVDFICVMSDAAATQGGGSSDEGSQGKAGPGSSSTGGAQASDGAGGSAGVGSSEGSTDADNISSANDACVEVGGELLPDGFCFKGCTNDEMSPGHDLFGDCKALHMVCVDEAGGDFCQPDNWTAECTSDADCGEGAVCVTFDRESTGNPFSYCHPSCSDGSTCGTLRCVTSCPNGYWETGWCEGQYGWPLDRPAPSLCTQ